MSQQQLLDQTIRHAVQLEGLKQSEVNKIAKFLREIEQILRAKLSIDDDLSTFSRTRLEAILSDVNAATGAVFTSFYDDLMLSLGAIAAAEVAFEVASIGRAAVAVQPVAPVIAQVQRAVSVNPLSAKGFQGKLLEPFIKDFSKVEKDRLIGAIRQGAFTGQTNAQIIRNIRGTKAANYKDGLLDVTRRNADAIVRTSIQHVSNQARQETWKANSDIVIGVRIVATLDSRTSTQCFLGSTKVLPIGMTEKLYARKYRGEVIVVRTSTGKELVGTPNHPVLTSTGWLPLNEVKPNEHVVYTCLSEGFGISSDDLIRVPTNFAKLANAAHMFATGNVRRESSSTTDFHGDGMVGQEKVSIPTGEEFLSDGFDAVTQEHFVDKHFSFGVRRQPSFFGRHSRQVVFSLSVLRQWNMPSQVNPAVIEHSIEPAFGTRLAQHARDDVGVISGKVQTNRMRFILPDGSISLTPCKCGHQSGLLEQRGNGSCGCAVSSADFGGRNAIAVQLEDVVSVRRKFVDDHVYNLQTSLGLYIADGFIVHNCRALDGRVFKLSEGVRPPFHIRCRTTTVAVLDPKYAGKDGKQKRASMNGPVDDQTYYEWLKSQPVSFQDSVLGVDRSKLLRDGGLSAERFAALQLDRNFKPITLDEMRRLEPVVFERAGL